MFSRRLAAALVVAGALLSPAAASAAAPSQKVVLTTGATAKGNELLYKSGKTSFSVTALHYTGSNFALTPTVTTIRPNVYSQGLGDNPRGDDRHTVDNSKGWDFLLFRFDAPVAITGATFANQNWYRDKVADTDASISYATFKFTPTLTWSTNLSGANATNFLNAVDPTLAAHMFSSNTDVKGTSSRTFNAAKYYGNTWLIGASVLNADGKIDSFKLQSITFSGAVPEPSTWAMLILGMGMVGAAMRGRPRRSVVLAS